MVCSSYIVDTVTDSYRSSCQAEKSNAPFVNFSVPTRCWTYDEIRTVSWCWPLLVPEHPERARLIWTTDLPLQADCLKYRYHAHPTEMNGPRTELILLDTSVEPFPVRIVYI
ncbi:Hypothetical protein NTJ_02366 [Nesidiocoris tenuis]|uniref:Uncharacterized protein n=1 Tax=Nesidiocoris tenuis TaxID=355587 RepID=A0ABN7AB57_9HEMI|nr:Hypothetical protein NTJ_02366 [Nesidiocoris tenuis]